MPPDFLTPERKKYTFLKKLIRKNIQKSSLINSNNKIIRTYYLWEAPGEHMYLPRKITIFQLETVRNQDVFYYKNKARKNIFEEKGINEQFCK